MKIGILTLPLHTNYGGILQAFAVQKIIQDMGHNVETLTLEKSPKPLLTQLKLFIKSLVAFCIGRCGLHNIYWPLNTRSRNIKQRADTLSFITREIILSEPLHNESELKQYVKKNSFDGFVVGSDQVWRPNYGFDINLFFLSFLDKNDKAKRVAFAASFGTEKWEFTKEQTTTCASLARMFDNISVREQSGVELCKNHLGVSAFCVIDPTMLLPPSDYLSIINSSQQKTHSVVGKLFSYILDSSNEKKQVVLKMSQYLNLDIESIEAEPILPPYATKKKALQNPPQQVEQWLRSFQEAEFVVTDSFHGTVFSILHHRPFVVLANEKRGLTRIETLLSSFGLSNRLTTSSSLLLDTDWLLRSIDWNQVDIILNLKREQALKFINEALG